MDHKKQHHEMHQHERAEKKKEQKLHDQQNPNSSPPIHPGWFWGIGLLAVAAAVVVWTFVVW